ncbi:MAG: hypothetical protein P8129_02140 [Anaerolineae bacterium]
MYVPSSGGAPFSEVSTHSLPASGDETHGASIAAEGVPSPGPMVARRCAICWNSIASPRANRATMATAAAPPASLERASRRAGARRSRAAPRTRARTCSRWSGVSVTGGMARLQRSCSA